MATSTIPAVKTALLALLVAELDPVQVSWAKPSQEAIAHESVWFDGADSTQRAEAMGNQRRDETFTLELIVSCIRDGDDAQGLELRMWEIVADVEQLVRDNPKPIPAPLFDIQYGGAKQRPAQAEGQRLSEAVVSINGRARI